MDFSLSLFLFLSVYIRLGRAITLRYEAPYFIEHPQYESIPTQETIESASAVAHSLSQLGMRRADL